MATEIATAYVQVPLVGCWTVGTTRGESVAVESTRPLVSEHGHLQFPSGEIFARNEWAYVTSEDLSDDVRIAVLEEYLVGPRLIPTVVIAALNDHIDFLEARSGVRR